MSEERSKFKRDEYGRFAPGTAAGPGRPATRDPHRFIGILLEEMTDDEIRTAWRVQIDKAVKGDLKAFESILDRGAGKPMVAIDIQADDPNSGKERLLRMLEVYHVGPGRELPEELEHQEQELLASGAEAATECTLTTE